MLLRGPSATFIDALSNARALNPVSTLKKNVKLKKHEEHRIADGHLWVFSNEISAINGAPEAGDIVDLQDHAGKFLGKGFYNPHSLIAFRLLTGDDEEIDFHFFRKRIESALALRKKIYAGGDTFRLVHGESDFLPGLIADRYSHYICIQTFSFGMDKRTTLICDVIDSLLHPKGIIERNETPLRSLEKLVQQKGILRGACEPVVITEHDLRYTVDLLGGQKTGLFLDQRENRYALRRYADGARVLDCCCNDGGFALNAGVAGAQECLGVDISGPAVQRATGNAALNNLSNQVRFIEADMFTFLGEAATANEQFDVVNLDPPSFAKSRKTVSQAKRGYKELHTAALRILKPGGILATASCSHHIESETFLSIIQSCALAAHRRLSLLEWHGAAPDHPVLPAMPETHYLKFGIFRVE